MFGDLDFVVAVGERFEFPFGDGVQLCNPGPQRIAIYQRTQPERGASLTGRMDFPVDLDQHL